MSNASKEIKKSLLGLAAGAVMLLLMLTTGIYLIKSMGDHITESTLMRIEKSKEQKALIKKAEADRALLAQQAEKERQQLADQKRQEEYMMQQAWQKAYETPADCVNPSTEQQFVECTNHKMRAKQQFEEAWRQGKQ